MADEAGGRAGCCCGCQIETKTRILLHKYFPNYISHPGVSACRVCVCICVRELREDAATQVIVIVIVMVEKLQMQFPIKCRSTSALSKRPAFVVVVAMLIAATAIVVVDASDVCATCALRTIEHRNA